MRANTSYGAVRSSWVNFGNSTSPTCIVAAAFIRDRWYSLGTGPLRLQPRGDERTVEIGRRVHLPASRGGVVERLLATGGRAGAQIPRDRQFGGRRDRVAAKIDRLLRWSAPLRCRLGVLNATARGKVVVIRLAVPDLPPAVQPAHGRARRGRGAEEQIQIEPALKVR